MRALQALVIFMGVLIVAGMATIAITLVRRGGAPSGPVPDLILSEPPGTQIASVSPFGARLAVLLHGGGADRVLIVDARGGIVERIGLKQ
jgi:Family of unknown function (DUF6476)